MVDNPCWAVRARVVTHHARFSRTASAAFNPCWVAVFRSQQILRLQPQLAARRDDEPDPLTRDALGEDYRRLHDGLGLTSVMITHDMLEALLLADRIVRRPSRGAVARPSGSPGTPIST